MHFEKKFLSAYFFKSRCNNAHHHINIIHNFNPGVMKFTILVNPSLVSITKYFICLLHTPRKEKEKKYCIFTV